MAVHQVLAAFDKFKGTATAEQLGAAVGDQARSLGCEATLLPLADGGEGSLAALGGANKVTRVSGPLGEPVEAKWRRRGRTAFIEMAEASGLVLVGGPQHNLPLDATTAGTGELINQAIALGVNRIIVFLGGSATTDGGWGALQAVVAPSRLKGVEMVVATDVRTPFTEAAVVFGPQKGASPAQVKMLSRRLERLAQHYHHVYGVDVNQIPGSGAAGGLAGALAALGGRIEAGFEVIADHLNLDRHLARADLVVTGEGRLDGESFNGKVVGGVWEWAAPYQTPVLAIVGSCDPQFHPPDGLEVVSLDERYGVERAYAEPCRLAARVVKEWLGPASPRTSQSGSKTTAKPAELPPEPATTGSPGPP